MKLWQLLHVTFIDVGVLHRSKQLNKNLLPDDIKSSTEINADWTFFLSLLNVWYPADAAITLLQLVLGFLTDMSSAGSFVVILSVTVRPCVCLCGFVERSVARAHGLLWGWLKAASLFAYQMTCGRENTDLHGRKQAGFDPPHRAEKRAGERDVRLGGRCVACFLSPCVCDGELF